LTAISHKLKRPHGPAAVELIFERAFVGKAVESSRRWLFRGREYDQYIRAPTVYALTPPSAEDESTILRQNLEAAHPSRTELRR
jgi:hypothetical protein